MKRSQEEFSFMRKPLNEKFFSGLSDIYGHIKPLMSTCDYEADITIRAIVNKNSVWIILEGDIS
jgi:hypothetical protein